MGRARDAHRHSANEELDERVIVESFIEDSMSPDKSAILSNRQLDAYSALPYKWILLTCSLGSHVWARAPLLQRRRHF